MTNPMQPTNLKSERKPSELATRVVSAIMMIIAALGTAYIGGEIFALFWAIAAVAVFWEWTKMSGVGFIFPARICFGVGAIAVAALSVVPHLAHGNGWFALLVSVVLGIFVTLSGCTVRDRFWIGGGVLYAAVIAFFPPFLREMPFSGLSNILWVFAVVWATDIAAYFVGRACGGPKLWPSVSPNKTWSGFCGGLIAGTLSGVAIVFILQGGNVRLSWVLVAVFSAIASILSQGGDLAESSLKRHFGVKDSSALIPGHGGAMDRLDGFWAAVFFLGMCLILTHMVHNWAA
ncbi:phosphatidate cytidylyltransferase [Microvirga sp. W0021]|uniref:Phosphatidate cytidylyltransferase n=1 Tax=Hohaiivirga grylli TaxID=3133970 RepID=A0ABV0BII6_9HYPH